MTIHKNTKKVTKKNLLRAVASSSAIETCSSVREIESKLKNKQNVSVTYFSKKIKISHKKRIFATVCILILVTTSGAFVYPSFLEFGPDEGINEEALNTIEWIAENLDINNTVIASDHRLERMIENLYNYSTTGKTGDDEVCITGCCCSFTSGAG